nr:hypothetical protein [Nostoc sp. ChiSLP01]
MWGVWGERFLLHRPTPATPNELAPSSHTSLSSHTSHTPCLPHTQYPTSNISKEFGGLVHIIWYFLKSPDIRRIAL